jgi:hypothetical protein
MIQKAIGIQNALERSIAEHTSVQKLLPSAIRKVAKSRDLVLSEFEVQSLSAAILNAESGMMQLDLEPPCGLGKTEEELHATVRDLIKDLGGAMREAVAEVTEAVSKAVPEAVGAAADIIVDELLQNAGENAAQLRTEQANRIQSVQRMWGVALDELDFLRNLVLEWGHEAFELRSGPYASPNTAFALNRLLARAYDVVGEIVVLGRNGYADGALARWRSLHELCVIAMFLSKQSDRCAVMYLSHHRVEELKLLDVDRSSGTANAKDIHSDRRIGRLRREKTALVARFGKAFAGNYGWASVALGQARTTFRELESQVGLNLLRRGYQRANSTVHGGALATLTRISLSDSTIDGAAVPPAYGCEIAANYATASLSMLVAELCLATENADLLTMSAVVHKHAMRIRESIAETQKNIAGDTPRSKILMRKAAGRRTRINRKRTPLKVSDSD